jgi:hypothetical protein
MCEVANLIAAEQRPEFGPRISIRCCATEATAVYITRTFPSMVEPHFLANIMLGQVPDVT